MLRGLDRWKSGHRLLGSEGGCSAPREQLSPASPPPPLPVKSLGLRTLEDRPSDNKNFHGGREDGEIYVKRLKLIERVDQRSFCTMFRLQSFPLSNALQCIPMPLQKNTQFPFLPSLAPMIEFSKTISTRIFPLPLIWSIVISAAWRILCLQRTSSTLLYYIREII